MIGALPVSAAAPLEYRYALDAAMPTVAAARVAIVRCNVPELIAEVSQRLPRGEDAHIAEAGLWIEPVDETYRDDVAYFARRLAAGAPLVVIASRPLARWLPECRQWSVRALGYRPGGRRRLRAALVRSGFTLHRTYGIHSPAAIALNILARLMARSGRADVADRLHAAARLRYCATGPLAALSTVALSFATRGLGR
jgi:hypothetical protein